MFIYFYYLLNPLQVYSANTNCKYWNIPVEATRITKLIDFNYRVDPHTNNSISDISGPTKVSSRKAYEEYLLIGSAEKHAGKSGARGKVVIGRTGSSRYNSVEDNHVPVDSGSNSNKKLKIALLCKIIFAFIAFWLIMYLDEAWWCHSPKSKPIGIYMCSDNNDIY